MWAWPLLGMTGAGVSHVCASMSHMCVHGRGSYGRWLSWTLVKYKSGQVGEGMFTGDMICVGKQEEAGNELRTLSQMCKV